MLRTSLKATSRLQQQIVLKQSVRSASALSPATVAGLPTRWEKLPESDKSEVIEALAQRQKLPWTDLTAEEKKAAFYVSFGEWGPRKPIHTSEDVRYIFWGTFLGVAITAAGFLYFRSKRNIPKTMNREWQQQSDEYLKSKNANPFTGYSQIQSK
ncbi:hypothetical protein CANARDRAFT_30293 [[Candida] arabinofermentans NRRL YB-2248]|uniref:Cytochrome c oxidase subunit IV n=1 Tax=[Candida] arabinofermentans NRRL YB-2248 TaxID=983967 RepID=A0A1E4SUE8_9ASCO|nr:hypothetical protein CANARDRAFT_30293 [[Candida] arabinofermentans NRRL YB-2248]